MKTPFRRPVPQAPHAQGAHTQAQRPPTGIGPRFGHLLVNMSSKFFASKGINPNTIKGQKKSVGKKGTVQVNPNQRRG